MESVFIEYTVLVILYFAIALSYSSVGLGGAAGYGLALLFFEMEKIKPETTPVMCNLIVAGIGILFYIQNKHLKFKKTFPIIATGIAGSAIGKFMTLEQPWIAAIILTTLATMLFINSGKTSKIDNLSAKDVLMSNLIVGSLVGIIGGIFSTEGAVILLPILYLSKWDRAKYISATICLYVLLSAVFDLLWYYFEHKTLDIDIGYTAPLAVSALFGSLIGTHLNLKTLPSRTVKKTAAILVFATAFKLVLDTLQPFYIE